MSETRPPHAPLILLADDQPDVLEALRLLLKPEGYRVETAGSPAAVLRAVSEKEFDLVLLDLNYARDTTSGGEGLTLIEQLHAWDSKLPIIALTAWASVDLAVDAMKRGARDFVQKPWENARLLSSVRTQIELGRALRRSDRLEQAGGFALQEGEMIATSPSMQPVLALISRIGPSDANVLVRGENGTGKGVVARAIHTVSQRSSRPFVAVNIGGLAESLFESELFGHVKGAFTDAKSDRTGRFELADGGTLFLDEIANISLPLQARLLRVVESGEFERVGSSQTRQSDVRLISATNANLEEDVSNGRFRRDLLFRLNTVEIRIPPLRERREDIPLLASAFLDRHARRYRKNLDGFDDQAMRALLDHPWPGNVRELDHVVERAVLMGTQRTIGRSDLGFSAAADAPRLEDLGLEEVEELLIRKALKRHEGNVSRAASMLGLSRSALYRRMQRYGIG